MAKPQDKEMKMQWITVDGRRTPIILPQIWDHEKEDWVVTSTENPLPTQVTGSKVEKEVVLRREIRTSDSNANTKDIPEGVTGFIVIHTVYGVTGNFEEDQGHKIRAYPYEGSLGRPLFGSHTSESDYNSMPYSKNPSGRGVSYTIMFHRDAKPLFEEDPYKIFYSIPILFDKIRYDLLIKGSFGEGEGVDSEVIIYWIFNG